MLFNCYKLTFKFIVFNFKEIKNLDMKNIVLVDFTPESEKAISFAVNTMKETGGELELVHVIDDKNAESSTEKMNALVQKYTTSEVKIGIVQLGGKLSDELSEYVKGEKIGFVYCGTHDMKFLEHILDSRALKLLNELDTNFIFVPSSTADNQSIKHVLLPIFPDKHSIANLKVLIYLQHFLKFKITLCTYNAENEGQNDTMIVASELLNKANIGFKSVFLGNSEQELMDGLIDFGHALEADTISIVNLTNQNLFNFAAKGFVESLIRNKRSMPIIAIQNQELSNYSSFHTQGGY